MTDANRVNHVSELDLLAYADGRLDDDPGRREAVEAALRADPEAMARAEAFRAQTEALRAAYGWRLAEPVPERLAAALERPAPRRAPAMLRAAAVVLLSVGAGTAGWMLGQGSGDGGEDPMAQRLAEQSYARFVADRPGEAAPAMDAVVGTARPLGWLGEEVSIRLKAPDLSEAGYALAEKAAVTVDGQQLVRLDYAGAEGRSFSLFLAPRWEARQEGIAQAERDGISMAYWLDGPLASTVVARMPAEETRALAESVREAMHADGGTPGVLEPDAPGRIARDVARDVAQEPELMADSLPSPASDASPQALQTINQGQGQGQVQPN